MTINYQLGDVDAHGVSVSIRGQAASLEAEYQAIARDALGDMAGTPESAAGVDASVLGSVASVFNSGGPSVNANRSSLAYLEF